MLHYLMILNGLILALWWIDLLKKKNKVLKKDKMEEENYIIENKNLAEKRSLEETINLLSKSSDILNGDILRKND